MTWSHPRHRVTRVTAAAALATVLAACGSSGGKLDTAGSTPHSPAPTGSAPAPSLSGAATTRTGLTRTAFFNPERWSTAEQVQQLPTFLRLRLAALSTLSFRDPRLVDLTTQAERAIFQDYVSRIRAQKLHLVGTGRYALVGVTVQGSSAVAQVCEDARSTYYVTRSGARAGGAPTVRWLQLQLTLLHQQGKWLVSSEKRGSYSCKAAK